MEEFQDTLTRCAKLEVRKRAALLREAKLVAMHHHERKQLQLAQDSMYKVRTVVLTLRTVVLTLNVLLMHESSPLIKLSLSLSVSLSLSLSVSLSACW